MTLEALLVAQFLELAACLGVADPPQLPPIELRDVESIPCHVTIHGTRYHRCRGKLYRNRVVVALDDGHAGGTVLHELTHYLLRSRDGDADGEHEKTRAWACAAGEAMMEEGK